MKKPNKVFIFIILLFMPLLTQAQNTLPYNLEDAHKFIIQEQPEKAIEVYASLVNNDLNKKSRYKNANGQLLCEYAYALALGGVYEGALINLDRVLQLAYSKELDFYISQVFQLMSYPEIANQFWTNNQTAPTWIEGKHEQLLEKFKEMPVINQDNYMNAFKRANVLFSCGMYFQSIILFQEITDNYPEQYLPYVGYSGVWEKLGYTDMAQKQLQKAINLTTDESKILYETHLNELQKNKTVVDSTAILDQFSKKNNKQFILYGGGMFSPTMTSINARYGIYTKKSMNFSVELGINSVDKKTYFTPGILMYKTWKWFVLGGGITSQIDNNSTVISLRTAYGYSFIAKNKKSSIDILFNVDFPFSGGDPIISASLGRTFFIDLQKK